VADREEVLPRRLAGTAAAGPRLGGKASSAPRARDASASRWGASAPQGAGAAVAESRKHALEGQSPREHRADARLQCHVTATDSSMDQSLEVERPGPNHRTATSRTPGRRGVEGKAREQRREGNDRGGPSPVAASFALHHGAGFPATRCRANQATTRRLTRHSYRGGESSEGWSAIGNGPRKPTAAPAASRTAGRFSGNAGLDECAAGRKPRERRTHGAGAAGSSLPAATERKAARSAGPATWRTP
jgi:hypothetical protein